MKTEFEYICFKQKPSTGKTFIWLCRNIHHGDELGVIKWHCAWRTYCYIPTVQAVYSRACLKDIAQFIDNLLEMRAGSGIPEMKGEG